MSNRQFSYTRAATTISPYSADLQYSAPASQQLVHPQETSVVNNYGYPIEQQGSNHQVTYGYSDSTYPNTNGLTERVTEAQQQGPYYHYNTEQHPYQNSIPTNHIVEHIGPQPHPELESDLAVLFGDNVEENHTQPISTAPQPTTETMVRETANAVASITGASTPPTDGQRFAIPQSRSASGKIMPPSRRGKTISRGDTRHNSGNDSESDENTQDSGSDHSIEEEEEVPSPSPPVSHAEDRKSKKSRKTYRRDREPSVSADPPVKRKKKSSHREKHRERRSSKTPERSPSRSPTRSVSVPRSVVSEKSSRNSIKHRTTPETRRVAEELVTGRTISPRDSNKADRRETIPVPLPPIHASVPPSTANERLTNQVFQQVLVDKMLQKTTRDLDNVSSLTKNSRTRQQTPKSADRELTWEALERLHLSEELQGTELARETIKALMRYSKSPKTLSNSILYIKYVKAESTNCLDKRHSIQIDTKDFLMCSSPPEKKFGYTHEDLTVGDLKITSPRYTESLHNALRNPTDLNNDNSLDVVLRSQLREMVDEVHTYNIDVNSGLGNPVFISGRYLELRLLQRIRNHYLECTKTDVIACIVPLDENHRNCELQKLVQGSAATAYLRRLIGLYHLSSENFNEIAAEEICTPMKMRIWTKMSCQREVNNQIQTHMMAVVEKTKDTWRDMTEAARRASALARELENEYVNSSKEFLLSHDRFLATVLESSELMAWMCFGITTNNRSGCTVMAESFAKKKAEDKNQTLDKSICFNFPLAAIFRKEEPVVQRELEVGKSLDHYKAILLDDCL